MTDNVIPLGNITKLDLSVDLVLDQAKGQCTEGVVVLGFADDGGLYFASSIADGGTVIWLIEQAKLALLRQGETE